MNKQKECKKSIRDYGEKVPNGELFSYAAGLAGQNMTYGYISGWLRYFCINLLHLKETTVGRIFFISYFWDAVNDPIIGSMIDRRRHKSGEKLRPYLLKVPLIIGILSVLLFANFNFQNQSFFYLYIVIIYFTWDIFYSIQDVALWGMVATSSPLSHERARVSQWVSIGAGAGAAVAGGFQMIRSILEQIGLSDMQIFSICALIFGLGGELISMFAYRMKERIKTEEQQKESVWKSLSILKHNPTLLLISLARFLLSLTPKIQPAYFFESSANYKNIFGTGRNIDGKTVEVVFGAIAGLPGAAFMFVATRLADKIGGMKKILLLSQIMAIAVRFISFFVGYQSPARLLIVSLIMTLMNIPGSLMDIAHRSLTSDSIDYVEWKTGVRSEGISFSMQNFTSKISSGVAAVIETSILSALGYSSKFKEAGRPQNDLFLKWQWPLYILGPVVGAVLYLIVISFVRDDSVERDKIERELSERRKLMQNG